MGVGPLDWEARGGFSEEVTSELKHEGGIQLFKERGRGEVRDRAAGAKHGKGAVDSGRERRRHQPGTVRVAHAERRAGRR